MAQEIRGLAETEKSRDTQNSLSKINPALGNLAGEQLQPVQYYVGLYSVNKRRMADTDLAFLVESAAYKTVAIRPCPADERYIKVMDIPHPVQWIEGDPHNLGGVVVRIQKAEMVAMNLVNPDVFGTSMDHLPPQSALAKFSISSNCDLIRQGVFFTRAEEGTPEFEKALAAAEARRDTFYQTSLDGLLGMSEDMIRQVMNSEKGLDLRTAAVHFGVDIPGIRSRSTKVDCPNCFEKMPKGAAFHRNELLGKICVIDWRRAVEAGVMTLDDVPPGKEWWDEDELDDETDLEAAENPAPAEAPKRGRGRPAGSRTKNSRRKKPGAKKSAA